MPELGDASNEIRSEIAIAASEFMPDLCDLIPPAIVTQGDGHTLGDGTAITNIPCVVRLGGGSVQFHDGESVVNKTAPLELPYTAQTMAITRQYKIKVHARGANSQLIFEQPVIQSDSMSPLLEISAVLTEGYRQPGIT